MDFLGPSFNPSHTSSSECLSDEELLSIHKAKADGRVGEIDISLETIRKDLNATEYELATVMGHLNSDDAIRTWRLQTARARTREQQILMNVQAIFDELHSTIHAGVSDSSGYTAPGSAARSDIAAPDSIRKTWELDRSRLSKLQTDLTVRRNTLLDERGTIQIGRAITLEAFATSPVVRLAPDDILLEIFRAIQIMYEHDAATSASAAELRGNMDPSTPDVRRGPGLLLSRVCSRWRIIACSYPPLWSKFSLQLYRRGITNLLGLYLERSGEVLLSVEIDVYRRLQNASGGERAIGLLALHSHRLFKLCFVPYWAGALPSLQPLRGNLSRLEILNIPVASMVSSKFWVVPRLHTLRLGSHRQLAEAAYNFDRTQIRTLALCDPNGHQLLPYPNVTDLTCIESSHFRANISFIGPPPISPRLKTLKINFSSLDFVRGTAANVPNIFRRFTAPALSSLDVQQLRLEPGELIDFLHRSQCNLTTLVLRQCLLRISGLLQILECTPNLGSFSAVDGHSTMITNRLFQYLSIGSDAIVNLPRLSSLTIRGSFAFEDVALVQMLETRMAGEDPHSDGTFICFSDVFLSLPERTVKPEIKARLRHLQGVTVSLECLNDNKIMCRAF